MLKWADETRRKLNTNDSQTSELAAELIADVTDSKSNTNSTPSISDGSFSDDDSGLVVSPKSCKAPSPVQRRRQKHLQAQKQRRRHSSCGQMYAAPEQIVLAWDNAKQDVSKSSRSLSQGHSLPSTPTDDTPRQSVTQTSRPNSRIITEDDFRISTKPELLRLTTKESDKNRQSFWKNLIGRKSWPNRTYKSPMRKSQSVIETYRKIEESYYLPDTRADKREENEGDYGLSKLVISNDSPHNSHTNAGESRTYHSLKTIRRQNENRRPKLFTRRSGGRHRSPDGGFSDIRLSMSIAEDLDTERDSGVPGSPALSSSSSSSSNDSACYRKH